MLGWVTNKLRTLEQLHRIFYAMRFLRRLDRLGYAHFRRWKLYGEESLARHPAVIIMLHASDEKRQRFFNYQLLEEPPASQA